MNPLDVISLSDAKDYLTIDYPDWDEIITDGIYAIVGVVEQYTNYRLYQRLETIEVGIQKYEAFQFPINSITSVLDSNGYPSTYRLDKLPLRWVFAFAQCSEYFYANQYPEIFTNGQQITNTIVLNVGYTDTSLIPRGIITAIKLLLSDYVENRIPTKENLPDNVQFQLSPYLRSTYI